MLDQIRLRTKLLLIAIIAVVPSIILLWLLISEKNIAIQFGYKEYVGNQYLRPMRQMQEALPVFAGAVRDDFRAAGGSRPTLSPAALEQAKRVDEALAELQKVDAEFDGLIKVAPRLDSLRQRWERERDGKNARNAEIFVENIASIRADLRRVISFVGDDSNLILDPDLDSYYMMDATLLKIPAIQDQITGLAGRIEAAFDAKAISPEDGALLLSDMGTFQATVEELERNMQTGFQNNPAGNLQPALSSYVEEFRVSANRLQRFIRERLIEKSDLSPEAREDYKAFVDDARAAGYRLWDNAVDQLDILLQTRIAGFERRKMEALAFVFAVLLLAGGAVYLVSNRITRRVNQLALLSGKIASKPEEEGQVDAALKSLVSKDEIGALADSTAVMAAQIRRFIAEIRASQVALEEYNATLEQRVADRTREIEHKNAELENALKLVKEAQNRLVTQEKLASLGSLTAGIAHEIKNPLNFVNNFAQLSNDLMGEIKESVDRVSDKLEAADLDDLLDLIGMVQQNVQKINEHGQRADGIVKGMLAHSRGKVGQRLPADLNNLVSEYAKLAYHGLRADDSTFNITFDFQFDSTIGKVDVIAQDLSRAILNIVNNGCYSAHQRKKKQGEGFEPTISIRTRNLGDRVELRIRDNGLGIPKEKLDKIFEPFYTTKPTGQGTGLGLSMTFDIIVQQHQGELRVDSVEGEFAEFVIVLPKEAKPENA